MKLSVKLHGGLDRYCPEYADGRWVDTELPPDSRVKDLLGRLNIPETLKVMVVVQGRIMQPDEILAVGDQVQVFAPMHGG